MIKGFRQARNWSQEQLAELSGLSLRTIQRIEGSNRVGVDSLAALAAAFDVDMATLERELAMDKSSSTWKKRPAWVRAIFLGSGRIQMDKQQHKKVERVAITAGIAAVAAGVLAVMGILVPESKAVGLLLFGSLLILSAYLMSVFARVGDEYSVWRWLDSNHH